MTKRALWSETNSLGWKKTRFHSNMVQYGNLGNIRVKQLCVNFYVKNFQSLGKLNSQLITYYVCWKYFMCLIFVVFGDYENLQTAKIFKLRYMVG